MKRPGEFKKYIDEGYPREKSIVLRYHPAICPGSLSLNGLKEASIMEGVKFFKLCTHKGVDIFLLDETTLMQTGTYKSIDGCICIAFSKERGFKKIAFSSGANTGMALTLYAQRFGIETFFFHPRSTLFKINSSWFKNCSTQLITVDRNEREIKKAASIFSQLANVPSGIEVNWRFLGAKCRALAICEEMLKDNINFSYVTQTVCAGFGPIGIYKMFSQLVSENILKRKDIPQFLGVQQSCISPMVEAWNVKRNYLIKTNGNPKESLIEPALYNTFPIDTYPEIYKLLIEFGGELISLSRDDYQKYSDLFISYLAKAGLELTETVVDSRKELLEKAGVISGAGIFKSIESGLIKKKAKVLCCLTGGVIRNFVPLSSPRYEIKKDGLLEDEIKGYIESTFHKEIDNEKSHLVQP